MQSTNNLFSYRNIFFSSFCALHTIFCGELSLVAWVLKFIHHTTLCTLYVYNVCKYTRFAGAALWNYEQYFIKKVKTLKMQTDNKI